jgi:hypothetical protein
VLDKFFQVILGLESFATVERMPNWEVERPEFPAAAVLDGAERAEDQNNRDLLITTAVSVEVTTKMPTPELVVTELNRFLGLVRKALADQQALGGYSQRIRYLGCDEPQVVDLTASPCEASLEMQFEIERFEQHETPYE